MMNPSWYASAFRNLRTSGAPPQPPSVPSPVGADDSTTYAGQTAAAQAAALRSGRSQPEQAEPDVFDQLPRAGQNMLRGGYTHGGFEGVQKSVGEGWYDIPEWQRRQILSRVTSGT